MYIALLMLILVFTLTKEHWPRAVGSVITYLKSTEPARPEQDEYG